MKEERTWRFQWQRDYYSLYYIIPTLILRPQQPPRFVAFPTPARCNPLRTTVVTTVSPSGWKIRGIMKTKNILYKTLSAFPRFHEPKHSSTFGPTLSNTIFRTLKTRCLFVVMRSWRRSLQGEMKLVGMLDIVGLISLTSLNDCKFTDFRQHLVFIWRPHFGVWNYYIWKNRVLQHSSSLSFFVGYRTRLNWRFCFEWCNFFNMDSGVCTPFNY